MVPSRPTRRIVRTLFASWVRATSAGGAGFAVGVGDGVAAGAERVGVWVARATGEAGEPQPASRRVTARAATRPWRAGLSMCRGMLGGRLCAARDQDVTISGMRLIPSPAGVRNAGANVLDRVVTGHLADLRPWPRTLIDEGPQRSVYH